MKNIDTLNKKLMTPKKGTVDFLLSFSRSMVVIRTKAKSHLISKN